MRVHWIKVKGHGGDKGNDAADTTATWAHASGYLKMATQKSPKVIILQVYPRQRYAGTWYM